MGRVFINYRNNDHPDAAGAIYSRLGQRLGKNMVFRDCDSIQAGEQYPAALRRALEDADVLVAVIGPNWLTLTDGPAGTRLIDRDDDWVRQEIAMAFRRGIPVVPVLLNDTTPLDPDSLPANIRQLANVQALQFSHRRFDPDMKRLVNRIVELSRNGDRPILGPWQKRLLVALFAILAVAIMGTTLKVINKPDIPITDLANVAYGAQMKDGEKAIILIPDAARQRRYIALTPRLTNPATVGDCVGPAKLDVELVLDGRSSDWVLDRRSGDEIRLDLKGTAREAKVLITVHMQDSWCEVDLTLAEVFLFN